MNFRYFIFPVFILILAPQVSFAQSSSGQIFRNPQPVEIENLPTGAGGTSISTEEPFLSRDGRFLFFNSGKQEGNKDLYYAKRIGMRWVYQGPVGPNVNTGKVLNFSRATWDLNGIFLGSFLDSDILFTVRQGDTFVFDETKARRIMKYINTPDMEYAACISSDGLELFFTHLSIAAMKKKGKIQTQIMRATRHSTAQPFGKPTEVRAIGHHDFVEGPTLSSDGRELYYHIRKGNKFRIYKVSR